MLKIFAETQTQTERQKVNQTGRKLYSLDHRCGSIKRLKTVCKHQARKRVDFIVQ